MKKDEVELILIKVSADGQDAISMKIYKNGTICRYGVGGLPQIGISGMSFAYNSNFFEPLIVKVPEEVLQQPINYEEPSPNGYLEYIIAFYGVSSNGDNGERASWTKSTGIRVKLDQQSQFNHPIMGFLDGLTLDAAELTNDWYFDIIMTSKYKVSSCKLPKETIVAQPKTEVEIDNDYENYIQQMMQSSRGWNIMEYVNGKIFEKEGNQFKASVKQDKSSFNIQFTPTGDVAHSASERKASGNFGD